MQDSQFIDRSGTNVSRMFTTVNNAPFLESGVPPASSQPEAQSAYDEYDALYKQYEQIKVERDEK